MTADWQTPDWLVQGAAWAASLVAAGGAKPALDWWRDRGRDRHEEKKLEVDTAAALRRELHDSVRELRADLDRRDAEIGTVRREVYELMAKLAEVTAENHQMRADRHRLLNWATSFYLDLQMRWLRAGLPAADFPILPHWIQDKSDGPTASTFKEPTP